MKIDNERLDVDIRFLLANERTLLAWVRTGLTLIAGGVAVAFVATQSRDGMNAGLGAILLGALATLIGYQRYLAADRAIRKGELPSSGVGNVMIVVVVALFAAILLVIRKQNLL
jgi:putative membrane protein